MTIRLVSKRLALTLVTLMAGVAFFATAAVGESGMDHYQASLTLQKNGQLSKAIEELKTAVDLEPSNAFYLNALGLAYIDVADYDNALQNLNRAVEIDDNLPEAYSGLGVCYNARARYQQSIGAFEKALSLTPDASPDKSIIYNNIGQNYYLLKQFDKAESALNKALELDDQLLTAYINLGNVYTERGDYKTALDYHVKAVEIAPAYPLPRNNLAYAYYKLGNYDKALEEMQTTLKMAPDNARFKENYNFLKDERNKHKNSLHSEGVLAGLPKEITLKDRRGPARPVHKETPSKAEAGSGAEKETAVASAPATSEKQQEKQKKPPRQEKKPPKKKKETEKKTVVAKVPPKEESPSANATTQSSKPNYRKKKHKSDKIIAPEPKEETVVATASDADSGYTARPRNRSMTRSHAPDKNKQKAQPATPAAKTAPDAAVASESKIENGAKRAKKSQSRKKVARKKQTTPAKAKKEQKAAPAAAETKKTTRVAAAPAPAEEKHVKRQRRRGARPMSEKKERAAKKLELTKPERAEEFFKGAKYNLKINDLYNAKNDIDRAIELYPKNPDYLLVTGMIEERHGLLHEAANTYRKVIDMVPNHSAAHNSLGHVHQLLNRTSLAEQEYQRAYDADSSNGCAAGNLGTALVNKGACDEAMDYLLEAVENKCLKGAVLNNFSLCYFKKGDFENAQQLSYRGLELEPRDETILGNFSYIIEKSGFNYDPIKVSLDTQIDPFYKLTHYKKDVSLNSLTPVEALDFNEVFRNNYNKKTVLVIPFENPRGTERWTPTPSEINTKRIVNQLRETGFFKVVVAKGNFASMRYAEKVDDDNVNRLLEEYHADVAFVGMMKRHVLHDRQNTRFKGLRKKSYVEGELPVETKIVVAGADEPLYDRELSGVALVDGVTSDVMSYKEASVLKNRAFDDYTDKINNLILDHYNLVKYPVRRDVVKYIKSHVPRKPAGIAR